MPTWCNNVICWSFFRSTCFGRKRPSSRALDVKSHGTFQTGQTTYATALRTTTHPQTGKTICCNLTSNAPDDGRMRPKHVDLKKLQQITLLHQVGISLYFMMKMHGQTTLKYWILSHFVWMKSSCCVLILYMHFINIYFRQHNCIIKAWVKGDATCFDLKSHPQAKLRTMKFFTVWLRAFGIPDGLKILLCLVSCT